METGRDPRELKGRGRKQHQAQGPSKTLDDAIKGFLSTKTSLKEFTLTNYRRQLENQVREVLLQSTLLKICVHYSFLYGDSLILLKKLNICAS